MRSNMILVLVGTLLITSSACLVKGSGFTLSKEPEQSDMGSENQENDLKDPCWFSTKAGIESGDSGALKKIRNRQLFGYEEETPISEAVRIFNLEEIKCYQPFRHFSPLTEDELIAAIVVGVNQNRRGTDFHTERDVLWRIATKRMMPKGAVLRAWNGGNIQESPLSPHKTITANGIEIFLVLGADKNGRATQPPVPKPEEILTIRKIFSDVEIK